MAKARPTTAARGLKWWAEMQPNCPGYQARLCLSSWNRNSTRTGKPLKNRTRRETFSIRKKKKKPTETFAQASAMLLPWTKKTATTIMHKIKTLFLSRNISMIRRLAQWHDWPRLRASLHTEAQSSLIFRYPMIETVF